MRESVTGRCTARCPAIFTRTPGMAGALPPPGTSRPNECPKLARLFHLCSGSSICPMHPVTPAGALVGRESEMTRLTGMIKEVSLGRGGSVLIEGEPGIGKSALVRAVVADAPEAGCQV